jgi:hypothetical protein
MDDLTDAERQFIEAMRETGDDDLRLVVQRHGLAGWEIEMKTRLKEGKELVARGVGKTFSEAWDNAVPHWA